VHTKSSGSFSCWRLHPPDWSSSIMEENQFSTTFKLRECPSFFQERHEMVFTWKRLVFKIWKKLPTKHLSRCSIIKLA
jgi:hypothetical protein